MNITPVLSALVALLLATTTLAQQQRAASIGYAYPAGGERGKTFDILVGGQSLRSAKEVYISGTGVRGTVEEFYPPVRNLNAAQRQELNRMMREAGAKQWAKLQSEGLLGPPPIEWRRPFSEPKPSTQPDEQVPNYWLWDDLENKSLAELMHIRHVMGGARKRQQNQQIAETVRVRITIDKDADPGDREMRLLTRIGLTSPVVFQVGTLTEITELENNDPDSRTFLPPPAPLALPVTVNGQVLPGDVDRFRFDARRDQKLVIRTAARRLVPFMADAVPGWFEAHVTVLDAKGRQIASASNHQFDPDPVLMFTVPETGTYTLEIRDSLYRGRDDFVYRAQLGELPFITAASPLSLQQDSKAAIALQGWNLWTTRLPVTGRSSGEARLIRGRSVSNDVEYAVNELRTVDEAAGNDTFDRAQTVAIGMCINGVIDAPTDQDFFRFTGRRGQQVSVEVTARRMGSPLDSLVRVLDASGKVIGWNDDRMIRRGILHPENGLQTHHADSHLTVTLPADGRYTVKLTDALAHGGPAYAYTLRIAEPDPDFELKLAPSAIHIEPRKPSTVTVHVVRHDDFDAPITLVLRDAPAGLRIEPTTIPAGAESMTLSLSTDRGFAGIQALSIEGTARLGSRTIRRQVVPVDEVEQAFLWHHLVPRQQLLITSTGGRFPQKKK